MGVENGRQQRVHTSAQGNQGNGFECIRALSRKKKCAWKCRVRIKEAVYNNKVLLTLTTSAELDLIFKHFSPADAAASIRKTSGFHQSH